MDGPVFKTKLLLPLIPDLMKSKPFAKKIREYFEEPKRRIIDRSNNRDFGSDIDLNNIIDEVIDAIHAAFLDSKTLLTVGWDGQSGCWTSGALWVHEVSGVYVVSSSDEDAVGPFFSLDDALAAFGHTQPPNPDLDSDVLPLEVLLKLAMTMVDADNDGDIHINGDRYELAADRKTLVLAPED